MARESDAYDKYQRARFMRPDAARFIRPDAARFLIPGTNPADLYPALNLKYNAGQPRVPAGQSRGGQWTNGAQAGGGGRWVSTDADAEGGDIAFDNGDSDSSEDFSESDFAFDSSSLNSDSFDDGAVSVPPPDDNGRDTQSYDDRLASSDEKPPLGRNAMLGILAQAASRVITAYRSANSLFDLFGHSDGAVAYTTVDDKDIFGANSSSPTYTTADRLAATDLRDSLIAKYPDDMSIGNLGQAPNNALFHAETNVLLRAAEANGGSLAGRTMDIYVDRELCPNCRSVLPMVGLELGNPTLTYVDPIKIYEISNGRINSRSKR